MYLERDITPLLQQVSKAFPIVLLTGPRQVGKSTLLKTLAQREGGLRAYVSLDDFDTRALAKNDPKLFLQRYQAPLIIDEIQYAPELFPYLKMHADSSGKMGDIWLTGSQSFALMDGVQESLAGRVGILDLTPLSQNEILQRDTVQPFLPNLESLNSQVAYSQSTSEQVIFGRIVQGGMPAVIVNEYMNANQFYSSYIRTYIERDVRADIAVRDEHKFMTLFRASAARIGQLLNVTDIARDCDITPQTAKKWLSLLEKAGLIYFLYPYSGNMLKRLVKAPKLYFTDTGLASYLTGWDSGRTASVGAMAGQLFENYTVSQIRSSFINTGVNTSLFYYRNRDGQEIDVVFERNGLVHPIEIKKSAAPSSSATSAFKLLDKGNLPRGLGAVICLTQDLIPQTEQVVIVPISIL